MEAFHTYPIENVLELFESSQEGLTQAEAQKRNKHYGPNALPESKPVSIFVIFAEQFKSPIIIILIIATVISFGIGEILDGWFIMMVLIINAVIGTYLEHSAAQKAHALRQSVKTMVRVLRDGKTEVIEASLITIGDVVLLESGDKVPADLRLLSSYTLSADESLLTGESIEIEKMADDIIDDPDLPVGDRTNMIHAGTYITRGRAKAMVVAIGIHTQIGHIATMLSEKVDVKIPLIERLERFSAKIAMAVAVISVVIFIISLYHGTPLTEIFFLTLALFVSAVPEGLPVAITVALAAAAVAMSHRNVIIRKLAAIEGLGSCTMIATDKTGTLTENRLKVAKFILPGQTSEEISAVSKEILTAMLVTNEAYKNGDGMICGDQVDVAFARFVEKAYPELIELLSNEKIDTVPYESQNKFSAAVITDEKGYFHALKGSPEVIRRFCTMTPEYGAKIEVQVEQLAKKGYRLIAVAFGYSSHKESRTLMEQEGFQWAGFAAITDPLREGAKEAVDACKEAGIAVAMITGDHPKTAYHIAKELGIALSFEEVIDAETLQQWHDTGADAKEIADKRVFARVSPEQKLQIVTAFQSLGNYVAVTGDGVNDAPALKFANIGIAMGKSGTDVAKENADLILTDDAFSSIVNGIEEGRRAYDNIRKVVHLLISTGFAEIVLIILSLTFGTAIPLLPIHLLWLNLVTNGIQDVALGLEKAEPNLLNRPPRSPKEPIFNTIMLRRVLIGGIYMGIVAFALFYWLTLQGMSTESARNVTLLLMVLFENLHALNSRSERISIFRIDHSKNMLLIISIIATQLLHIAVMHLPATQHVLEIEPVDIKTWLLLLLLALGLVVVMESEKFFRTKALAPGAEIT